MSTARVCRSTTYMHELVSSTNNIWRSSRIVNSSLGHFPGNRICMSTMHVRGPSQRHVTTFAENNYLSWIRDDEKNYFAKIKFPKMDRTFILIQSVIAHNSIAIFTRHDYGFHNFRFRWKTVDKMFHAINPNLQMTDWLKRTRFGRTHVRRYQNWDWVGKLYKKNR